MQQYIVTVKYTPAGSGIFDKGVTKFRVDANNEDQAKERVKKNSLFPTDGIVIRVRYAAYKTKSK